MRLETLRHSTAHVMAYAVKELFPGVKFAIGPSIENGFYYDFDYKKNFTPDDLNKIEQKMCEIIKKDHKFKKIKVSKQKAKKMLKGETYKLELLKELKTPSFYQCGDFIDLCKGPHVKSTKDIKAFKLMKIAGAYWKGSAENKQLQRIYGTAFFKKDELKKYLNILEEAEKRDHVKLGKELELFSMHEEGPGFPFFLPKGLVIWDELMKFWYEEHKKAGYQFIRTPIILNKELWEQSGHWENYRENMYTLKIDNEEYAVKPMNCPGAMLIYKEKFHSYKELPLRVAEVGLVHRHELSGVLHGLVRVRSFYQDDAHIYMTEKQMKDEVMNVIKLVEKMYKVFGLEYHLELSTMPKKHIGTVSVWKKSEKILQDALKSLKKEYKINSGDGAFYGPKIDFHIKDSLARTWQCATIQLDMSLPDRFDLFYEGKDGKRHRPVMIHRVVYGALERFIAILIEHYTGKFPLWLSPVQVKILSVADRFNKYAEDIKKKYEEAGIGVEVDGRTESISKKVREAQLAKINYIIVVGEREKKDNTVTVRSRNNKIIGTFKHEKFLEQLLKEIKEKR